MTQFELFHNMLQKYNVYHEITPGNGTNQKIVVGRSSSFKNSFEISFNSSGTFVSIEEIVPSEPED